MTNNQDFTVESNRAKAGVQKSDSEASKERSADRTTAVLEQLMQDRVTIWTVAYTKPFLKELAALPLEIQTRVEPIIFQELESDNPLF
jgi:hypothetical protein